MQQRTISGITRFLVVGGDGFLGSALSQTIQSHGGNVTATSRRCAASSESSVFLDLYDEESLAKLDVSGFETAFICAGVSKYSEFDATPLVCQHALVENTILFCSRLMDAGCFIVYLSTSAVFSGEQPYVAENSDTSPTTAYGRHKCKVEQGLLELTAGSAGVVAIVRISKVLAPNTPIICDWYDSLSSGENIYPLSDLRISPVSLSYVVEGLIELACAREQGVFHLSGERDITYADLASGLADQWGFPSDRVRPVTSKTAGVLPSYTPRHPSLGMTRAAQAVGKRPQSLENCIAEVAKGLEGIGKRT